MRPAVLVGCLLVFALACGGASEPIHKKVHVDPVGSPGLAAEGGVGVTDAGLRELLVEHWDWVLRTSPVWATTLGDHRFDARIADDSLAALDAMRAKRRIFLTRTKSIPEAQLDDDDRRTLALFAESLANDIAIEVCQSELWSVSARDNPLTEFNVLPQQHRIESAQDARNFILRLRRIPTAIDDAVIRLRAGIDNSVVANQASVALASEMVKKQLLQPLPDWPLSKVADTLPATWPGEQRAALAEEIRMVVADEIRPALDRYQRFLERELLPNARGPEAVGLLYIPHGEQCYEARIQYYTGLALPAQALHEFGLSEVERINDEMRTLGKELFGTDDLAAIIERLRTDRTLYFEDAASILAKAKEAVAKARAAIPRYFGVLPKAEVVVVPTPAYEAPYSTIAYYRQPHADGSKPGEYVINTFKPEVRPRFEMEVLAFHEAIPGHHLQIAISQERSELPAFRRHTGSTAFVEGWALYSERLADEMGLYSGPLDRMGMLSYDAWRASRLVVDTGIHALGWTREQAETFMLEHTALTRDNIVNEVDRYITWPGQALAYKVGQQTILQLRERAKTELGARFDLPSFHDAVLTHGAVSLPVLKSSIESWIQARQR